MLMAKKGPKRPKGDVDRMALNGTSWIDRTASSREPVSAVGRRGRSRSGRNQAGDGVFQPGRTGLLPRRHRRPFLPDEADVDLVPVGNQQRLDVRLVLRPE